MKRNEKILCVDDEINILLSCQRSLRKKFQIEIALDGEKGLEAVASRGPYAVIVSDMRMPGMDGIQFLTRVKEMAPDSVRMMLTGVADQHTAIEAVNEGNIFRFLSKPCSLENLAKTLEAGVQQYRLVTAEKELLEKTLSGSVQVLTDVLSLVNPTAFGLAARVRRLVSRLAAVLQVPNAWQVEIATMLSHVGCVTVPEETLMKIYKRQPLSPEESRMFQAHPQIGHDLIVRIPRLEPVAEIIAYQEKLYDGQGLPQDDKRGPHIPLGARILKVALDFDKLDSTGFSKAKAYEELKKREGWYDPAVIKALKEALAGEINYDSRSTKVEELSLNMLLAEDLLSPKGLLLLAKRHEVTSSLRERLRNLVLKKLITEPIKVLVPSEG